MDSRREFIKKAAMIAGASGLAGVLPASIQRALAIDPAPGSSWLDAEHVVILMQENRSFDHCYGNLRGVRGYRDPRAIKLADGNPVWFQTNHAGETYAPFRLDIKGTMATWMGSLPHSWTNQVDARNDGRYDQWLHAKPSGHPDYAKMPLTMGYYDRRDIPFYYSLADAFTVCDQNFCSCLTGTTPNRLYLWSGTIRDGLDPKRRARVRNQDTDYRVEADWTTFPERLEDAGVDWRIYQNEISAFQGFKGEEDAWLSNFTDNPIEWFSQYNIRFSAAYMPYIDALIEGLKKQIDSNQEKLAGLSADAKERGHLEREIAEQKQELAFVEGDKATITKENYEKLSQRSKNLLNKAFTRNVNDPHFHELDTLEYQDGAQKREAKVPKGDVLFQFRQDVQSGMLPTVSWLVAPENFSDHPGAPWYGAWYVSEVLDILTKDPEVWKKTVFVLCYDENDGYFDHVPPFVAPDPSRADTGKVTDDIDAAVEFHTLEQDHQAAHGDEARGGPIGLGYRVPLVIASPWSRGGFVNSQVSDHTSILQMLEQFVSHKTGKELRDTNISAWRRAVCGDLSSVFRPYNGEKIHLPDFLGKDATVESIHKAKFKGLPSAFVRVNKGDQWEIPQEKGSRPSNSLPYELYADGEVTDMGLMITMRAGDAVFGKRSAGAAFTVYSYGKEVKVRNYAMTAGRNLTDLLPLEDSAAGKYHIDLHGPNGFHRSYRGDAHEKHLLTVVKYEIGAGKRPTGKLQVQVTTDTGRTIKIVDHSYKNPAITRQLVKGDTVITLDTGKSNGWYDFSILTDDQPGFERRYAGRVETGRDSVSDPAMG